MKVTLENLTEAFRQWQTEASTKKWEPTDSSEETAIARAVYLLELLENIS